MLRMVFLSYIGGRFGSWLGQRLGCGGCLAIILIVIVFLVILGLIGSDS